MTDLDPMIINFAERQLARQLNDALRHSAGVCGVCNLSWGQHTAAEIQQHCVELARQKAERACPPPPIELTRPDRLAAIADVVRGVALDAGLTEIDAERMGREVMRRVDMRGVVR